MNVAELQKKLGVELPSQYEAVLKNFPTELRGSVEHCELLSSLEQVFSENENVRKQQVGGKSWPLHMIVIGGDGAGNLHVIDNRTEPAGIWMYQAKSQSFSMIASSLSHWFHSLHEKAKSDAES
jgi:hypothetical protein